MRSKGKPRLLAACLATASLLAFSPPGQASVGVPEGGVLNYWVVRDGSPIGTHSVKFSGDDKNLTVDIATDVKVKVAFVTVYKFIHQGHEVWQDGQLVSLASKTDDDGTPHDLSITRKGDKYQAVDRGKKLEANANLLPASLWHPKTVESAHSALVNTLDGTKMAIDAVLKGEDEVKGLGGTVLAKHYQLSGELERELWFDPSGILVKVRFKGKDGSDIQYILR
jgi:hypothetical protein